MSQNLQKYDNYHLQDMCQNKYKCTGCG